MKAKTKRTRKPKSNATARTPKLVLAVRHGEYYQTSGQMTGYGRQCTSQLARKLADLIPRASRIQILTSPQVRAQEATEIIRSVFERRKIGECQVENVEELSQGSCECCVAYAKAVAMNPPATDVLIFVCHGFVPSQIIGAFALRFAVKVGETMCGEADGLLIDTATGRVTDPLVRSA